MSVDSDLVERLHRKPGVIQHFDEPRELASGELSHDFVDGKLAVEDPDDLEDVGAAMHEAARRAGAHFEAVGGLVLGAVPFTFAVAQAARVRWFLVRKQPKGRGTNRWIEGARLKSDTPVMLVDDVVTTGGSIRAAHERIVDEGARVVFATCLVDRGDVATEYFAEQGIAYEPLVTYRDLDIEPVGGRQDRAAATR